MAAGMRGHGTKSAVVLMAYSHGMGATYHLTRFAVELQRIARTPELDVLFASTMQEQVAGCWAAAEATFPGECIVRLENEGISAAELMVALLRRYDRVVAHVQGLNQLKPLLLLKQQVPDRLKIVATVHAFRNTSWRRHLVSWIISQYYRRYVDYTVFNSPFAVRQFNGAGALFAGGRAGIALLGVEDFSNQPDQRVPAEVARLADGEGICRLICLANFHPNKGQVWLLRTIAPILRRRPHVRVVLAGEGPLLPTAKAVAVQEGLGSQVDFPGRVDRNHVPWLVSRCNVGLVVSRTETFGHNYVEPMALGLPVVGTRVGVGEWLIQDFVTGMGFDYGDAAALCRAVEFMVEHPCAARQMGQAAQSLVRQHFTWRNVAMAHTQIYRMLLQFPGEFVEGDGT